MGILTLFSKQEPVLLRLPTGSLSVDRDGAVVANTLPSSFPEEILSTLATSVLTAFREAAEAQLPLSELIVSYPILTITAREMRGGAIIFFSPQSQ